MPRHRDAEARVPMCCVQNSGLDGLLPLKFSSPVALAPPTRLAARSLFLKIGGEASPRSELGLPDVSDAES